MNIIGLVCIPRDHGLVLCDLSLHLDRMMEPGHTHDPSEEDVFAFLVNLRDSGVTNMWGAGPFVAERFGIDRKEGGAWLAKWIGSFDDV